MRTVGIAMNGVTGRMGTNQHLIRSILAIRRQGGVAGPGGPDDLARARARRAQRGQAARAAPSATGSSAGAPTSTRRSPIRAARCTSTPPPPAARADGHGASDRGRQARLLREAVGVRPRLRAAAGAPGTGGRRQARRGAGQALPPGPAQAAPARWTAASSGASSRCAASSATGSSRARSRPPSGPRGTTAPRTAAGILADMLPHWRYVLDDLFGAVRTVYTLGATHIPERVDEPGASTNAPPRTPPTRPSSSRAGSSPSSTRRGACGSIATSWWSSRSTAPTGARSPACAAAASSPATPRRARSGTRTSQNPTTIRDGWLELPDQTDYDNGFKVQWEMFLRHVAGDEPFPGTCSRARKGIQLAELAERSWEERRMLEVPELAP